MTEQYNIENPITKLEWNTPEVQVLSINEETLAGTGILPDGGLFS